MAEPAIPSEDVRRLSSRRWLASILAIMSADGGSRFGVMVRRLTMSRSVLSLHLQALEGFGWIARNPGHGHPLRPDYVLTPEGRPVAAWCERLVEQRRRFGFESGELGRWSLPLLMNLRAERKRFTILQQALAPVTPRALSLALSHTQEAKLVEHQASLYGLTRRGRAFAEPLLIAG